MRMRAGAARHPAVVLVIAVAATVAATVVAAFSGGASAAGHSGSIVAVGAENEYASVISQVGGRYVQVSAIMSNPSTDPHEFEASPAIARDVGAAQLVVQNGLGYDAFMSAIESATPGGSRTVVNVQQLLKLPDSTPNPHLWYQPGTMAKVADAVAADLSAIQPAHAGYFRANARAFVASLDSWYGAIAAFKHAYPGTPVATTEPVADYLLIAAGADNLTPWTFQAAVMNGVDPSPQIVAAEKALFTGHKVKVFLYNQQVADPLTESLIALADASHIPVVAVYETMPVPGFDYQTWMLTEVQDLKKAVADHLSTEHL